MTETHRAAIEAVLQPGETLEWSGGPDKEVMKKTLGKRKQQFGKAKLAIAVIVVAVLLYIARELPLIEMIFAAPGMIAEAVGGSEGGITGFLPVLVIPLVAIGIVWWNRHSGSAHVENLSYGITDRRVLIVRKGEIYESWNASELQNYSMNERVGADGYHDIIWDRRATSSGTSDSPPSALDLETARVGFKALPNGPAVLARLDAWRRKHDISAETATRAVLAEDALETGALERLVHPVLGFSIVRPPSWSTQVRRKKVIFGKTGIDLTANRWSSPGESTDWNVILVKDAMNTELLLEVAETAPTVTLESMTNSRALKVFARDAELFDEQADLEIGGMRGFGFSMRLPERFRSMMTSPGKIQAPSGSRANERLLVIHQAVVHDGRYQYYFRASWEDGDALQEQACRRMIESLRGVGSS